MDDIGFLYCLSMTFSFELQGGFFGDAWSKSISVAILSCSTGDILCSTCLMETIELRSELSKGNLSFFK